MLLDLVFSVHYGKGSRAFAVPAHTGSASLHAPEGHAGLGSCLALKAEVLFMGVQSLIIHHPDVYSHPREERPMLFW